MDVTYQVYQRVVLTRGKTKIPGRVIAVDPYKRHPYLVHLDAPTDDYVRAKGEELEPER